MGTWTVREWVGLYSNLHTGYRPFANDYNCRLPRESLAFKYYIDALGIHLVIQVTDIIMLKPCLFIVAVSIAKQWADAPLISVIDGLV